MQEIVLSYLNIAWKVVAAVGWYVIAALVVLLYTGPQLRERYDKWRRKRADAEYSAKYHKNVDLYQERLTEMEIARQKMQEKYLRDAEIAKQTELERIEKKKQAVVELTQGKHGEKKVGQSSGEASTSSSSLKQGYNPLMGDSSRGYRAPKRSCCGKGGCG